MNAKDKKTFIRNLCNSVRDELVAKVKDMPEGWDSFELRQLLADKFERETCDLLSNNRKRMRAYRNEVIVRNL